MKKSIFLSALAISALIMSGCSPKNPKPANPDNSNGTHFSNIPGGVTEDGKYTGQDGVSASGIKMIYFPSDQYVVQSDQIQRIMSDMPKIKALAQRGRLHIEGNCDEVGTDEYNHALGLKRAKSVKQILVSNGIPNSKIDIVSYGESNPVCTQNTPVCHAKNRRVEINLER